MLEDHIFPEEKGRFAKIKIKVFLIFKSYLKITSIFIFAFISIALFLRSKEIFLLDAAINEVKRAYRIARFASSDFNHSGSKNIIVLDGSIEMIKSKDSQDLFVLKDAAVCGSKIKFKYTDLADKKKDKVVDFVIGDKSFDIPDGFHLIGNILRSNFDYKFIMKGGLGYSNYASNLGEQEKSSIKTFIIKNIEGDFVKTMPYHVFHLDRGVSEGRKRFASCGDVVSLDVRLRTLDRETQEGIFLRDLVLGSDKIWPIVESVVIGKQVKSKTRIFMAKKNALMLRQKISSGVDSSKMPEEDKNNKSLEVLLEKLSKNEINKDQYLIFDVYIDKIM